MMVRSQLSITLSNSIPAADPMVSFFLSVSKDTLNPTIHSPPHTINCFWFFFVNRFVKAIKELWIFFMLQSYPSNSCCSLYAFFMPSLFVYHSKPNRTKEMDDTFKLMKMAWWVIGWLWMGGCDGGGGGVCVLRWSFFWFRGFECVLETDLQKISSS